MVTQHHTIESQNHQLTYRHLSTIHWRFLIKQHPSFSITSSLVATSLYPANYQPTHRFRNHWFKIYNRRYSDNFGHRCNKYEQPSNQQEVFNQLPVHAQQLKSYQPQIYIGSTVDPISATYTGPPANGISVGSTGNLSLTSSGSTVDGSTTTTHSSTIFVGGCSHG
jgi:hypothetical protein